GTPASPDQNVHRHLGVRKHMYAEEASAVRTILTRRHPGIGSLRVPVEERVHLPVNLRQAKPVGAEGVLVAPAPERLRGPSKDMREAKAPSRNLARLEIAPQPIVETFLHLGQDPLLALPGRSD